MSNNWSDYVRKKVKRYDLSNIIFTKTKLLGWLEQRNKCSKDELKNEIHNPKNLVHVEKQILDYKGNKEERYRCYFVYSGSRGRCYILKFNSNIKVITVFPLGRITLRKYKKKFK